jgi:hypothetical protein
MRMQSWIVLNLALYGNNSNHALRLRFIDSTVQTFQATRIAVASSGRSWYDHIAGTHVVRPIHHAECRGFEPILTAAQSATLPPPPAPADSAPA